ncbi:hypothetical protein Taro_008924 [Colocasia esculenta]|uniref:NAC domain-containing protein n=1 Tax=Colocasia esculenta TaxID=4460 RepID=A0A843U3L1_COLES|nr:hypothetical protein [Colocasia esculenta]
MDKASLPPGFRFHPTDVELVCYYLKRKIFGKPLQFEGIKEVELYKFAPWDLPEKSGVQSKDLEWYFYCPGDRKYANGVRKNRATDIGYWKTTGKDRPISYNSQTVAMKKTLVFHLGRAPNGVRTDWVMHEYRLEDKKLADAGFLQDAYVVCRIFKKSGPGPKNGEQYGAPFKDDDWEDDKVDDSSALVPSTASESLNLQKNLSDHILQSDTDPMADFPHHSTEYFNANRLLLELSENNNDDTPVVQENHGDEIPTVANEPTSSVADGIYDDLEDLPTQLELKSVGDISFSNDMEEFALQHALLELANQAEPKAFYDIHSSEEHILHCNEFGIGDGSYMEMKDFLFSVEGQCSDLVTLGSMREQNSSQSLSSKQIPEVLSDKSFSPSGLEDSSGTAGGQHLADFHYSSVCQTSNGIGSTKSTQLFAGGEQRKLPSESPVTNHGNSHAKLQHLFSSIHGRPAIAAEYPSALKEEKLSAGISHYRSAIHVNAEVTLQYACTEDCHLISSNDLLSASSGKQMQSRKIPSRSHSSGSGFAFVFFLGVVSALMWVFVLTLGAKLGKRACKFFLSW